METDELYSREFRKTRFFALVFLVWAPLIYLVIGLVVKTPERTGGEYDMLFYILLIVAMVQPAAFRPIEKLQLDGYRRNSKTAMTSAQLFTTMNIIKYAMIEAIYIFGLVVYFVSGNITRMLFFFPVGVVWSFIYWPRRSTLREFMRRVEDR